SSRRAADAHAGTSTPAVSQVGAGRPRRRPQGRAALVGTRREGRDPPHPVAVLARARAGEGSPRRAIIALPPVSFDAEILSVRAGDRLGPFEILAPLGAGGMGEVWRASDTRLGREVAIKILPPHLAADADALSRFEREARSVAALSHPNILALHDFAEQDGIVYAVTELLEGETLGARLERGTISPRKIRDWGAQAARALGAAHDRGIVHRDVKPDNLFITNSGTVKLLDFGLARHELVEPRHDAPE